VKFTSQGSAEIYVPKGMVSTLIGKGGENIRSLQDELGGLRLSVSSFREMPEDVQVGGDDHDEVQDRRASEAKAWEYSRKGRKGPKGRRR
jgi:transcription antitermination factor NusA-like protein